MANCLDYIKGGEVLIAPRLDYKYQYLLKCNECGECFCFLGPFVEHCSSHYERDQAADDNFPKHANVTGDSADTKYSDSFHDMEIQIKLEPMFKINVQDPLTKTKDECEADNEENYFKPVLEANESNTSLSSVDYNAEDIEQNSEYVDDEKAMCDDNEADNSGSDATDETQCSSTSTSIKDFMKCDQNLATIIEAYKNEPELWSTNFTAQVKPIPDRLKCLKTIAQILQKKLNIRLSTQQISQIIVRLRHKYRSKLENEKVNGKRGTNQKKPELIEGLSYLKPYIFVKNISIEVLDSHPNNLLSEQIVQLLGIYKRYPQLWNTDTMENCCKSKREQAFSLLKNNIEMEMDLEVDENSLKKYFRSIHGFFSKQKRRDINNSTTKEPRFEYYEHMMYLYNYVGPFKCEYCERLFNGALQLKAHRYLHEGCFGLKCPQCKKGFKSVEPYTAHVRRHMNDLGVKCNICGKGFLRTADLDIHMRAHTGARPFFCDICGSSFRQSQAFQVHRRRHGKQHSHFCTLCSKGCYTKNELSYHMRTHRNDRDFKCEICGKAFKTKKTMQQHTFIHEEGRNHMCPLCGRGYKNKIGLGHHLKTHGNNTTPDPDLTSIFFKE